MHHDAAVEADTRDDCVQPAQGMATTRSQIPRFSSCLRLASQLAVLQRQRLGDKQQGNKQERQ